MDIIYIDVLVVINIYIGYFLIAATKKLMHLNVSRPRIILASLLSGALSMIILLDLNAAELLFIRIGIAMLICFTAFFRKHAIPLYIKCLLIFFLVSIAFGGAMMAIYYTLTPVTMQVKNGVCYFDINVLMLVIFTIVAYAIISLTGFIMQKRSATSEVCPISITVSNNHISTAALIDTGNKLVDVFTGLPIMVCELKLLQPLLPTPLYFYLMTRGETALEDTSIAVRIIPINVVSGEASLIAFKPQYVTIRDKQCDMLVAVTQNTLSDGSFHAIIGSQL